MLYGADGPWWDYRNGVPDFHGAKLTCSKEAAEKYGLTFVECAETCYRLITAPGYIGSGGNSGFQAVNIVATVHRPRRMVFVGFDMRRDLGVHWHGEHGGTLNNPGVDHFVKWRKIIDDAAADLSRMGIEAINASACSALTAYPVMTLREALQR